MILIKVYKNGYENLGHARESVCHQVSLWHWITSNMLLGLDDNAKEYTSHRDNLSNPSEGYSWATFNPDINNLKWLFDDMVVSIRRWTEDIFNNDEVRIEWVDGFLIKDGE